MCKGGTPGTHSSNPCNPYPECYSPFWQRDQKNGGGRGGRGGGRGDYLGDDPYCQPWPQCMGGKMAVNENGDEGILSRIGLAGQKPSKWGKKK